MTAYYNEIDPHAAQWLRTLISEGHIAPGHVDERSIVDVRPADLIGYVQVHFFAGIGGWSYALRLAEWPDDRPVWTGSCPCQPFSLAGEQKGFADARHLWPVLRSLIEKRRPAKFFGEQVASATEWLRLVRGDLEAMEYAVGLMPIEAASAGADHLRDRYWIVADADDARSQGRELLPECAGERSLGPDGLADAKSKRGREVFGDVDRPADGGAHTGHASPSGEDVGLADSARIGGGAGLCESRAQQDGHGLASGGGAFEWAIGADGKARRVKPGIRLLAHGVPGRVGLLRGFGNAIDPRPAAEFIRACQ